MNFYEIIILRNIPFHENRECISIILASEEGSFQYEIVKAIDRSIDHFCGDDEMNWNEEKSREENREKNKKKKKKEAHRIILARPIIGKKFTARSLSVSVSVKEKIDFVFTSKRSDCSRYFAI